MDDDWLYRLVPEESIEMDKTYIHKEWKDFRVRTIMWRYNRREGSEKLYNLVVCQRDRGELVVYLANWMLEYFDKEE
jgi:hypothetical protein